MKGILGLMAAQSLPVLDDANDLVNSSLCLTSCGSLFLDGWVSTMLFSSHSIDVRSRESFYTVSPHSRTQNAASQVGMDDSKDAFHPAYRFEGLINNF